MPRRILNLSSDRLIVEIIRDDRTRVVDRARGLRRVGFQVWGVEVLADRVARGWPGLGALSRGAVDLAGEWGRGYFLNV
jgi:hypothetical protein